MKKNKCFSALICRRRSISRVTNIYFKKSHSQTSLVCLSVRLSVCLSIWLAGWLCVCLSIHYPLVFTV